MLPPASRRRAAAPRTQIFGPPAFDGAAAIDNQPWAAYTPPDPTGSIGPSDYVEIVNSMIAVYDPSDGSTLMAPQDLQSFFIANHSPRRMKAHVGPRSPPRRIRPGAAPGGG